VHEPSGVRGEPGSRHAVYGVVVDGEGEVEDISHFDAISDRVDVC
jgi:hypothetical protein